MKIIDFGLSVVQERKTQVLQNGIGTCTYMAPEVINGKPDSKIDIWACGIMMYILLFGKYPFDGKNDDIILDRIKIGKYDINKELAKYISPEGIDLM